VRYEIHNGECAEVMASMEPESVDAIVTDAPYGLSFMGAKWDSFGGSTGNQTVSERQAEGKRYADENKGAPRYGNSHGKKVTQGEMVAFQEAMTPIFEEALRVAKPGAHLLCFGGTRTFHRMACAIEDAGWEIRDCIMWTYGSGMPHGQRVERLMEGRYPDEVAEWSGWNTALKPAWEPVLVARSPLDGTVAHNVATYGTGAINIGACRIPTESHDPSRDGEATKDTRYTDRGATNFAAKPGPRGGDPRGRFPANLVHDGSDEVLACFPDSDGQIADRGAMSKSSVNCYGDYGADSAFVKRGDSGSAARFFYCAKASKKDRNRGGVNNNHPSVKPNDLMRWLVRLVCRPGGVVLDPFMGSGSTGVACMDEGMDFVGIELDPHYCEIAEKRMAAANAETGQMELAL